MADVNMSEAPGAARGISYVDNAGAKSQDNALFNNNSQGKSRAVENFLRSHAPQLGQVMPDQSNSTASRFPSAIEKGDGRDQRYALVREMVDDKGVIPYFGQYHASAQDLDYINSKILDAQEADFKGWLLAQMDLSTPEKQHFWQQKFPEVFQEKLNLLEKQLDIHHRLAKINIFGHRNMDDYMLSWAIQKGYIKIPKGPIFDPENLERTDFHRGLFNVKKWFAGDGKAKDFVIDTRDPVRGGLTSKVSPYPSFNGFGDFAESGLGSTGARPRYGTTL